jgi:hypothetical protein
MNDSNDEQKTHYLTIGIPVGAGFGVALGLILMTVLDHNGMFALGIAIGLTLGTTIGMALDMHEANDHDND